MAAVLGDLCSWMDQLDEHPWLFASLASILVGLSGILPLLVIPIDSSAAFEDGRKFNNFLAVSIE